MRIAGGRTVITGLDDALRQGLRRQAGGNFIPDDADLQGMVEIGADGSILLRDVYLGSRALGDSDEPATADTCGHVLQSP